MGRPSVSGAEDYQEHARSQGGFGGFGRTPPTAYEGPPILYATTHKNDNTVIASQLG